MKKVVVHNTNLEPQTVIELEDGQYRCLMQVGKLPIVIDPKLSVYNKTNVVTLGRVPHTGGPWMSVFASDAELAKLLVKIPIALLPAQSRDQVCAVVDPEPVDPSVIKRVGLRQKISNWEGPFSRVIDEYRRKPYVLGSSDCWHFVRDIQRAIFNDPTWPGFEIPSYTTPAEGLEIMRNLGAESLETLFAYHLTEVAPIYADRGCIALMYQLGTPHLGIYTGSYMFYGAKGLTSVRQADILRVFTTF